MSSLKISFQKLLTDEFNKFVTIFLCAFACLYILVYTLTESQVDEYYFDDDEIDLVHHEEITDDFLFYENMTLEIVDTSLNVVASRGVNQQANKHYAPTEFAELLATYSFEMDVLYDTYLDETGAEYTVVLKQYLTAEDLRIIRNLFTVRLILITLGTILIAIMVFSRFIDTLNRRMEKQFAIIKENFAEWRVPIETKNLSVVEIHNVAKRYNQQLDISLQQEKQQHQMVASLSHDLRSPITSIKGYAELLSQRHDMADMEAVKFIYKGAVEIEHLSELLSEQLKYHNNSFELKRSSVEMGGYLQDICAERYKIFDEHQIDMVFDIQEEPVHLEIDILHLKRSLHNLMNNLVAHNPKGTKGKITAYSKKDSYYIDIMDDGLGIEEDQKEDIFEAFYSTDAMRKDHSGLGLFISKKIVEKHGGSIHLLSDPMYKTVFRIKLPLF